MARLIARRVGICANSGRTSRMRSSSSPGSVKVKCAQLSWTSTRLPTVPVHCLKVPSSLSSSSLSPPLFRLVFFIVVSDVVQIGSRRTMSAPGLIVCDGALSIRQLTPSRSMCSTIVSAKMRGCSGGWGALQSEERVECLLPIVVLVLAC